MDTKADFVNPETDLDYAYELWRNVCSYHGPGGDFRYCEHLGECCTCFGGGLWDLEGWDSDGLPIFGETRSYIPDYEENRVIYAEDPVQDEWDEADDAFVPMTRTEKRRQQVITPPKKRKWAQKPRYSRTRVVESLQEVEERLIIEVPQKAWRGRTRRQNRAYFQGDCYWRKHNAGVFPRYTFFLSSRFERNFKAERQKERLRVQTQKALWWHRLILDYFPHLLPEHVQETHFSNVRYQISQCEKEVEKLLSTRPDTLYPQFVCSTRCQHRWEADLEHVQWKISYWTEKLRRVFVYAA